MKQDAEGSIFRQILTCLMLFLTERKDVINICCGVGKEDGIMPFYMIDERSGRNSFSKEDVEWFVKNNPEFKVQEVKNITIRTLQDILDECSGGRMPDYMSIDIEGLEYEVLSIFD